VYILLVDITLILFPEPKIPLKIVYNNNIYFCNFLFVFNSFVISETPPSNSNKARGGSLVKTYVRSLLLAQHIKYTAIHFSCFWYYI